MKKIFILLTLVFLFSCKKQANTVQSYHGKALGTTYSIQFFNKKQLDLETGIDSVFQAVNKSISTYQENSDISKINRGEQVQIDSIFREVFVLSQDIYRKTNGYFDPTVGNLVNAYGFGPEGRNKSAAEIPLKKLMLSVGLDKVSINGDNLIQKENPGVYLDFNAIGKGYAVDQLSNFLSKLNIENYLVEVGGEIFAHGKNRSDSKAWKIGIDSPEESSQDRELANVITLKNKALATSGNYRKYRIDSASGEKFVHTVNPKTGQAQKSNLLSVSVIATDCATADAFATAFMAMGFEKAKESSSTQKGISVYFIYAKNGQSKTYFSEGFKSKIVEKG
jgi:thiamine biosynthesis lipoprotein